MPRRRWVDWWTRMFPLSELLVGFAHSPCAKNSLVCFSAHTTSFSFHLKHFSVFGVCENLALLIYIYYWGYTVQIHCTSLQMMGLPSGRSHQNTHTSSILISCINNTAICSDSKKSTTSLALPLIPLVLFHLQHNWDVWSDWGWNSCWCVSHGFTARDTSLLSWTMKVI